MELLALDTEMETTQHKFWAQKSFYAEDLYKVGGMANDGYIYFFS